MKHKKYVLYSVKSLEELGYGPIARLPYCLRILLENLLRHYPQGLANIEDIDNLASWRADAVSPAAVPFMPARVILQDFTGVAGPGRSGGDAPCPGAGRRNSRP